MDDSSTAIARHLIESARVKTDAAEACAASAHAAAGAIALALKSGGKLMLCGNGGSAADCQHIAAEFAATLTHANPRPALAAVALTTDTSFLTAYANDFGFAGVFARQVEAIGKKGDVLLGISTSGNSANVLAAMAAASAGGMTTIALTGSGGDGGGGKIGRAADIAIIVPSADTAHIQEVHIAIGHALTASVEVMLGYGADDKGGAA